MSPVERVEARRMRWAGRMTYAAIAAAFDVHQATIWELCRDMPGPCRRRPKGASAAARAFRADERRRARAAWTERACTLRSEPRTVKQVAAEVGHSVTAVRRAVAHLDVDLRGRTSTPYSRQTPPWVVRAGLAAEFRAVMRDAGEHAAAAHCRRLTAEMRSPSSATSPLIEPQRAT